MKIINIKLEEFIIFLVALFMNDEVIRTKTFETAGNTFIADKDDKRDGRLCILQITLTRFNP